MSTAYIKTVVFEGMDIVEVEAQAHIANGQPSLNIVGLGDKAVRESRDRIKAALHSIGITLPPKRITINLAPSDVIKEGSHFDLPIALAILLVMRIVETEKVEKYVTIGELALDGRILPVQGVLPAAIYANAIEHGLVCPKANGAEACMASSEMEIVSCENLQQLVNYFRGTQFVQKPRFDLNQLDKNTVTGNFYDVRGQFGAKRALEIAAAGGHHVLMYGPPGVGKSMLASRFSSILPDMVPQEILESNIIKSISGQMKQSVFSSDRPYRDPHHSSSMAAIIGGGKNANPGEISLAHNGVLFLDELAEFPKQVLDGLRQPIENGYVTIARANKHVTYPANFQLIAAMNPCKCGYFGNPAKECKKVPFCASDYQAKISGPIMDRIDIHVEMSNFIPSLEDDGSDRGEQSEVIQKRVIKAREMQRERYKNDSIELNKFLVGDKISQYCKLNDKAKSIMKNAIDKMDLSMRSYNKILKVSRTIADLNQREIISEQDLLEALAYRSKLVKKL